MWRIFFFSFVVIPALASDVMRGCTPEEKSSRLLRNPTLVEFKRVLFSSLKEITKVIKVAQVESYECRNGTYYFIDYVTKSKLHCYIVFNKIKLPSGMTIPTVFSHDDIVSLSCAFSPPVLKRPKGE